MIKLILLTSCLFVFSINLSLGQDYKQDSAQVILNAAIQRAQKSNKNVLLIFHATWCIWCARLDSLLEEPAINKIIDEYYIVAKLDIREKGEKVKTYENPGGMEILDKFGGKDSGIPFIVFINKNGKMIANSDVPPKNINIGYPGSDEENKAFIKLLKKTAPRITRKQLSLISEYLEKHTPK